MSHATRENEYLHSLVYDAGPTFFYMERNWTSAAIASCSREVGFSGSARRTLQSSSSVFWCSSSSLSLNTASSSGEIETAASSGDKGIFEPGNARVIDARRSASARARRMLGRGDVLSLKERNLAGLDKTAEVLRTSASAPSACGFPFSLMDDVRALVRTAHLPQPTFSNWMPSALSPLSSTAIIRRRCFERLKSAKPGIVLARCAVI